MENKEYHCILNTLLNSKIGKYQFGDIMLFQEYKSIWDKSARKDIFLVSKPKLVCVLCLGIADQAIEIEYIQYRGDNYWELDKNQRKKYNLPKDLHWNIDSHIEWTDMINILGYWKSFPNFRELLSAYRKYETRDILTENDIFLDDAEYKRYKREQKLKRIL